MEFVVMLPETTKKRLFTFSIYVWVINILTLMPQYEDLGYWQQLVLNTKH